MGSDSFFSIALESIFILFGNYDDYDDYGYYHHSYINPISTIMGLFCLFILGIAYIIYVLISEVNTEEFFTHLCICISIFVLLPIFSGIYITNTKNGTFKTPIIIFNMFAMIACILTIVYIHTNKHKFR